MKSVYWAVAASLLLSSGVPGWAQEKAAPAAEAGRKETSAQERKAPAKPAASFFTGAVESLDAEKGTLTVRSRKGIVRSFTADEKARGQMKSLKAGDRVVVKSLEGTALSIVKPGIKKKEEAPPSGAAPGEGKGKPAPGAR